jgi:hypothetical protein
VVALQVQRAATPPPLPNTIGIVAVQAEYRLRAKYECDGLKSRCLPLPRKQTFTVMRVDAQATRDALIEISNEEKAGRRALCVRAAGGEA